MLKINSLKIKEIKIRKNKYFRLNLQSEHVATVYKLFKNSIEMAKIMSSVLLVLILFSCGNKTVESEKIPAVPSGAIPIEYDTTKNEFEKEKKAIRLKGNINGNIPVNIFFDTGKISLETIISDSLRSFLSDTDNTLQIGDEKKTISVDYLNKDSFFFRYFGANAICIGWRYFENQIIEISYCNEYIKVLEDLSGIAGYEKVKIEINGFGYLTIPIEIYLQGEKIKTTIIIDTGFNDLISLSINHFKGFSIPDSTQYNISYAGGSGVAVKDYLVKIDSIKAGYTLRGDLSMDIVNVSHSSALLGNAFFENFDVVLDLKAYNLYLKPIE
jgi:hypothetical protein